MLDLGRTFLQSVERSPNSLAVVDGERRLSYGQWRDEISRLAGGLRDLGLKHGDRILVVLQNRYEMATLHWACQFLGIVVTPLNWRAKPEEIAYCVRDAGALAVFYEADSAEAALQAEVDQAVPRIAVGASCPAGNGPRFEALFHEVGELTPEADSEAISLMLYTSGTTGNPKGVPRRHRQERAAALGHVAQNLYRRGERTLGVMPLYHTMGVRSLLSMALVDGVFVCMPRFDAEQALTLIGQNQITNLYLVPTLYHDMAKCYQPDQHRIASVRKLGFAGASMPDGLLLRLQDMFQPELFVNHYGSSEVYTVSIEQNALKKPGCAGRAGINTRLRVVDLERDSVEALAPTGVEGQIIADLRGDEAFEGYWHRPDADKKCLRDGWYFTGDIGYLDEDGDLFVTGRVDDMMISGGENISPVDIESVLSLHPAVDEVAVVGLKDERWGQRVTAFIKLKAEISKEELDAHCRRSDLPNFKRPRDYVFVRDIPKSPVGKLLRRLLVAGQYELHDRNAS
ncbi:MAG: AMP-binding protein [Pigmentiphaga sp.]